MTQPNSTSAQSAPLIGIGGLAALGTALYTVPEMVVGAGVGAGLGASVGWFAGIACGVAAKAAYTFMDPQEARAFCPGFPIGKPTRNAQVVEDATFKATIALCVVAGAVGGAYVGHVLAAKPAAAPVTGQTEATTGKSVGFNRTMQEAVDEFRQRTGETVYVQGARNAALRI